MYTMYSFVYEVLNQIILKKYELYILSIYCIYFWCNKDFNGLAKIKKMRYHLLLMVCLQRRLNIHLSKAAATTTTTRVWLNIIFVYKIRFLKSNINMFFKFHFSYKKCIWYAFFVIRDDSYGTSCSIYLNKIA